MVSKCAEIGGGEFLLLWDSKADLASNKILFAAAFGLFFRFHRQLRTLAKLNRLVAV